MNIVWVSDIHLNFLNPTKIRNFASNLVDDDGLYPDHIIITGDISEGDLLVQDLLIFEMACKVANPNVHISYVLGNHCYYKGYIADVRQTTALLSSTYLTTSSPVELSPTTCLIGTDGWCDAALGDIYGRLIMNDWYQIKDLRDAQMAGGIEEIARKCADLAREEVANLQNKADKVLRAAYKNVIVATHVPPWKESAWHQSAMSNDEYLPWFSSYTMGVFLEQLANDNPGVEFTVLCGHVHTASEHRVRDNMICYTGQADYGCPSVAGRLTIDDYGVKMVEFDNPYRNKVG